MWYLTFYCVLVACVAATKQKRPNIVFIFTDDQDLHHDSLQAQKSLQKHVATEGITFTNHYATVSVCCPSRVSLLRGQLAHNTNNTAISAPGRVQ